MPFVHISDTEVSVKDVWTGTQWNLANLYTNVPQSIHEILCHVTGPSGTEEQDGWAWLLDGNGVYTIRSAYHWLLQNNRLWNYSHNWDWIWHLPVPEKVRLLVWLVCHQALPTNLLRNRRGLALSSSCSRCNANADDLLHCLRDCHYSLQVWSSFDFASSPEFLLNDVRLWVKKMSLGRNNLQFLAGLWWVWRWCCMEILGTDNWSFNFVYRQILHSVHDF